MKLSTLALAGAVALGAFGLSLWLLRPAPPPASGHPVASRHFQETPENSAVNPAAPSVTIQPHTRPRLEQPGKRGVYLHGREAHTVTIQLQAEYAGFEITESELVRAETAYIRAFGARKNLERSLVQVEKLGPLRHKVVIPAFEQEGVALRDQFRAELTSILGTERADYFWSKAASAIERENFGWGHMDQVLDVEYVPSAQHYEIRHGFALADSGPFSNFVGVSGSTLAPEDLDIYRYLQEFFPASPAK